MCPLFGSHGSDEGLAKAHEAQHQRIAGVTGALVGDLVLGANDGIITTFAIVAAAAGGHLGAMVVIILGFANLLADGISMGASNFLGRRSSAEYVKAQRESEEWAVENLPRQERNEVREIFRQRGLRGEQLEAVVEGITQSKAAWVDIMVAHELGLGETSSSPWKHAVATFLAFVAAGLVPLIPYLFCTGPHCFAVSAVAAGVTLFAAGSLRTLITRVHWLRGGMEMLAVGSAAAAAAYAIGLVVSAVVS